MTSTVGIVGALSFIDVADADRALFDRDLAKNGPAYCGGSIGSIVADWISLIVDKSPLHDGKVVVDNDISRHSWQYRRNARRSLAGRKPGFIVHTAENAVWGVQSVCSYQLMKKFSLHRVVSFSNTFDSAVNEQEAMASSSMLANDVFANGVYSHSVEFSSPGEHDCIKSLVSLQKVRKLYRDTRRLSLSEVVSRAYGAAFYAFLPPVLQEVLPEKKQFTISYNDDLMHPLVASCFVSGEAYLGLECGLSKYSLRFSVPVSISVGAKLSMKLHVDGIVRTQANDDDYVLRSSTDGYKLNVTFLNSAGGLPVAPKLLEFA